MFTLEEIIVDLTRRLERYDKVKVHGGMLRAFNKEKEAYGIAIHNLRRVQKYQRQFSDAFVRDLSRRRKTTD